MREQCVPGLPSHRRRPGNEAMLGSTAASNVNSVRNALLMNFYVEFRICKQQKENNKSVHCISVITQGDYFAVALV